jgi:hypothetical protein
VTKDGQPHVPNTPVDQASFSFVPNLAGTYLITLSATDKDGGVGMVSRQVVVVPPTTPTAPSAPTGLATTGTAWSDHVEFSWQDNADDEEYYLVEWSDDGQEWFTIDELPADSTSYVDEYPVLGSQYYRVSAGRGVDTVATSQSDPITVVPIAPPVAWYDDNGGANDRGTLSPFHTVHDHPLTFSVVPNDVDYDSSSIFIPAGGFTQPSNGSITFDQQTGLFTYTPNTGYVGTDTFTYWVNDGFADSAPATVAIDVTNALPELGNIFVKMEAPTYSPFNPAQWKGQTYFGAVPGLATASDADLDPVTFRVVDQPAHGTVDMDPQTGQFLYVMGSSFNGADSFTYTAGDGLEESAPRRIPVMGEFQVSGESGEVWVGPPAMPATMPVPGGSRWKFPVGGLPEHGTMWIITMNSPGGAVPAQTGVEYNGLDMMSYQPQEGYQGLDHYSYVPIAGDVPIHAHNIQVRVTGSPPTMVSLPNSIYYKVSNIQPNSFVLSKAFNDITYSLVGGSNTAHGNITVGSDGYCTYSPTVDSQTGEPYYGWDFFKVSIQRPGAQPLEQEIQLQLGDFVPPPVYHTPKSEWAGTAFNGTLEQLAGKLSLVQAKRNAVIQRFAALGESWQPIATAMDGSAEHILPLADGVITNLNLLQSAYLTYLDGWLELMANATTYQSTIRAWFDNYVDPDTYASILGGIQALPRDIGGMQPNSDFIGIITQAFDDFGDAAVFQVNLTGTIVTTAEESCKVLAAAGYTLSLGTGVPINLSTVTTRAGLTSLIKHVSTNYVVGEIANATMSPAMNGAVAMAAQAGVDPLYVQAGVVALQMSGALKVVKPKVSNVARPFYGKLAQANGAKRLQFPGVNATSKSFVIASESEYETMNAAAAAAKTKFIKDLANDATKVSRLEAAGITPADINSMKLGFRPEGFDVHHKTPLKLGGDNSQSNFMLMQTGANGKPNYHGALTNYQNSLTNGLESGTSFETMWPDFDDIIYP